MILTRMVFSIWIGTNGKNVSEYTNLHLTGLVTVHCSEGNVNTILLLLILVIFFFPSILTLRCNANAPILSHWRKTIVFHLSKDNCRFIPCETSIHHHLLLHG